MLVRVWVWLKANWRWLLFPAGLLVFLAGWLTRSRSTPVVVSPALQEAAQAAARAGEEADRQAAGAARVRDERVRQIEVEHAEALKKLTDAERAQVRELQDDPEKLNQFLVDVGRQTRG
jgi:hypothetical protein